MALPEPYYFGAKIPHWLLKNEIGYEALQIICIYAEWLGCEIAELNVQVDHVHPLVNDPLMPPHCGGYLALSEQNRKLT